MYAQTMKVYYLRVQVWRATCEACSGNWEVSGTIPAFAVVHKETCVGMAGTFTHLCLNMLLIIIINHIIYCRAVQLRPIEELT